MAPLSSTQTQSNQSQTMAEQVYESPEKKKPFKAKLVWRNIAGMTILHILAVYGLYLFGLGYGSMKTMTWMYSLTLLGGLGITAGAHRLWCHKCYKAKWPLRVLLAIGQTLAGQNDIYEWSRDHRVHHKFSETDGDPHNSNRGFFFAHMGWLLCKKHPDVFTKGKSVDMTDLWADPIVRFQRRFYFPMLAVFWYGLPVLVPYYFWNESLLLASLLNMSRYVASLHQTWLVNSAAHMWGWKPYDKLIQPVETSMVTYLTVGEGYHNYHHTFPWDYSASEYGWQDNWNPSTAFINFMASIGWAYDLKKPSQEMIDRRRERTGEKMDNRWRGWAYFKDYLQGFLISTYPIWLSPLIRSYTASSEPLQPLAF